MVRLFIDPGSHKSGWALFKDKTLISSGVIKAKTLKDPFKRLAQISQQYLAQFRFRKIDEIHIEQILRTRSSKQRSLFWSVGVIGTSLSEVHNVSDGINPRAWQSYCKYKKGKVEKGSPLSSYVPNRTEDELSAVGMGLYYLNKEGK